MIGKCQLHQMIPPTTPTTASEPKKEETIMPDRIDTPLTNEHFAAFCLSMLGLPYWYGTALHKCSDSLLASKARQYQSQ